MKWVTVGKRSRLSVKIAAAVVCGFAAITGVARADQVVLNNGDKLNGKVGLVSGGVMKFNSPSLGDLSIKLEEIKSYSTDTPATLRMKNREFVTGQIKDANADQITLTDGKTTPTADVQRVNPPPVAWTGSIVANGALTRGNANTDSFGLRGVAVLRRDTPDNDDRLSLDSTYNLVRTGRGIGASTTTDNLGADATYDIFFSDKFYGYGNVGYYHDRIARLDYRLTPGVGIGYQWFEQKDFNLSTEAGVAYLYQKYQTGPIDQNAAYRLAYHVDKALNDKVMVFNDAEFIAPFRLGQSNRYVLSADAGIRAKLTKSFFSEFKVNYHRNDHPLPGTLKDDLAFLLGVGWQF